MNAAIKTDENKRLIVILTSHFEIDQDKFDDAQISSVIMKLYALQINIIFLGFEMNLESKQVRDKINEKADQNGKGPLDIENQIGKGINTS